MADVRADPWSAKLHGEEPRQIFGSLKTDSNRNRVSKRSFNRAINRARLHGYTWYHGRLYTSQQLGVSHAPIQRTQRQSNVAQPAHHRRSRLTCLSWNCGGLSTDTWDGLQHWLTMQNIDVVMLQETHWAHLREWSQDLYHVIHSGHSTRQAGLMCMIRKAVCSQHDISWREVEPGRILHIRVHGRHRNFDLVNLYQFPFNHQHHDSTACFWDQLHTLLHQLPKRNMLFLAGDLNTSADRTSTAVGLSTYQWKGHRVSGTNHEDSPVWLQFLKQFDLQTLNTWDTTLGPTYQFEHQHSRIDFLCVRRLHSDQTSRQVRYPSDFSLLPLGGAFHVPLLTSIRRDWHSSPTLNQPGWSRQQRMTLLGHCLTNNDHTFQHFQSEVASTVRHLSTQPAADLKDLHASLSAIDGKQFQRPKPQAPYKSIETPFQLFHSHATSLRRLTTRILPNVFQVWYHLTQLHKARRMMKHTAKATRRQRLAQIYDIADRAEKAQDHFTLFQCIRELAPKQPYRRILLRTSQGQLLGPRESADWIRDWYQDMYTRERTASSVSAFQWPFTLEDFAAGLRALPAQKALAPSYAPAPHWRSGAQEIAEFLQPHLEAYGQHARTPSCWSEGTICFLTKANKSGSHPKELRPITLLEPTGKIAMGLLARALDREIGHHLCELPLFAYLCGRGCSEAIMRLTQHCNAVKQQMDTLKYPLHVLAQDGTMPQLVGGITMSLDLSRAFDTVDRDTLLISLQQLGTSSSLLELLHSIYHKTTCDFWHRGEHRTFCPDIGIRQGCKCAPYLWTAFTASLLHQVAARVNWSWVLRCLTLFADDVCIHQQIASEAAFGEALRSIGALLDVLAEVGLELNIDKAVVILRLRGKRQAAIMRRYVKRTPTGAYLRIPRGSGEERCIRLVRTFKYLGVQLSYYNFARETMNFRLQSSQKLSQQLHRWLFASTLLTAPQKARIWMQCVFACLRYGLIEVGFDRPQLFSMFRSCMRQLRRIFREPVYMTRENHTEFLRKHRLRDPLQLLRDLCTRSAWRSQQKRCGLATNDILNTTPMPDYEHLVQVIDSVITDLRETAFDLEACENAPVDQHSCTICGQFFFSLSSLRRHQTLEHGHRPGPIRRVHDALSWMYPLAPDAI